MLEKIFSKIKKNKSEQCTNEKKQGTNTNY